MHIDNLYDYEEKHINFLKENASECCLFLKKDGSFPIKKPCKVALFGNGGRNTIKGGTGSGDIISRTFLNIEETLKQKGFEITTTSYLDCLDAIKRSEKKAYIKRGYSLARKYKISPSVFSMGYFDYEKNYSLSCENYYGDIALYILSRNSGEGNDRNKIKGDVYLSDKK